MRLTSLSLFLSACLATGLQHKSPAAEPSGPLATVPQLLAGLDEGHPELAHYRAALEIAQASRRGAGRPEAPVLGAEIGHRRERGPSGLLEAEGTVWTLSLSQSIEWPGRLALRRAIADAEIELATLGLEGFRLELRGRLAVASCRLGSEGERVQVLRGLA